MSERALFQLMPSVNSSAIRFIKSVNPFLNQNHSVETALIKKHNNIMVSLDLQEIVILVMLDMSAAFDTVYRVILLSRLQDRFEVCGVVLVWIRSYLTDREQSVMVGNDTSKPTTLECGVPQGSVLGPLLFSMYLTTLNEIAIES